MREYTREAIELSPERSRADLERDRLLNLALVRLCELIDEAASGAPAEVQGRYSRIPWPQIVSFRNRLIHGYDSVDPDIVWQVITVDLPPLLAALEVILPDDTRSS